MGRQSKKNRRVNSIKAMKDLKKIDRHADFVKDSGNVMRLRKLVTPLTIVGGGIFDRTGRYYN